MQRRHLVALAAIAIAGASALTVPAWAQSNEIRIAHVYSKTGPLEAYGKQTQTGFLMGLDYATGGTMTVAGKKIVVIEKDDQGKLIALAYSFEQASHFRTMPKSAPALAVGF